MFHFPHFPKSNNMDQHFEFPTLPTLEEFVVEVAACKDQKAKVALAAKYEAIGQAFKESYPDGCFFKVEVEELSVPNDDKSKICHLILDKMPAQLKTILGGVALRGSASQTSRMCANVPVRTLSSYASLYGRLGTAKVQVTFVNWNEAYQESDGTTSFYKKPNFIVQAVKITMDERIVAKVERALEASTVEAMKNPTAATPARRVAGDIEA